jgi:hypothetical protein
MTFATQLSSTHVMRSAIALEELRLVYVPVPKAGSTAILWALAEAAGLDRERFHRSAKLEVARALTIHDSSAWGGERVLSTRPAEQIASMLESSEWLTFTVVREPVRRIWSAWFGKVLLREPRFVTTYGHEPWFPPLPESAADVVAAFHRFVDELPRHPKGWHDPHWSCQADLLGLDTVAYDLVARVEELPEALARVDSHLRQQGRAGLELRRENPSLVPFVPELLAGESWDVCVAFTEPDREAFGYEPPPRVESDPGARWQSRLEAMLPAIRAVIERNERIGDLKRLLTRSRVS